MNDFEVQVFNRVHPSVAPLCAPNMFVSKQIISATAFPAASLVEIDNYTNRRKQTSTPVENVSRIVYQFEAHAMSKSECRAVFAAADEAMIAMNFSRISGQYIDNPNNPDISRYVARYEAEVDREGNLYRVP